MIRVVADHKITFLKGALEDVARVDYLPGGEITREHLLEADALITRTRTRCDRSLLEGSRVKFIASATIGHDHIDAAYCREAGISWENAPGCNSSSVRQYLVSTLLYLSGLRGLDLCGLTLGVVGVGNVGAKVALAAEALGMKVLLNDPPRARKEGEKGFVSLEEILEQADVLSLHVPLNDGGVDNTFRLVDEGFIARMKQNAILVNTSRGGVVDQEALKKALKSGKISDAVLDVFQNEPEVNGELLELLTLATPHIAGYSLDGKANGTTMAVRAVSRHFKLGLEDWEASGITAPPHPLLLGDAAAEKKLDLVRDLYLQTYNVANDDKGLRENPAAFEALRGDYPLRREPSAYSVRLFQGYPEIVKTLEALGFSVLADHCA